MTTDLLLDVRHDAEGGTALLVAGEIDQSNVDEFADAVTRAVAAHRVGGERLTVDLTGVMYLDSAAISVLYANADAITLSVAPRLVRVLSVSGISELVSMEIRQGADTPEQP